MLTLARDSETETLIHKSRFISLAFRADSEDEFHRRLEAIRGRFPGANHYVWAYVIREADGRLCIRFSDDGEPKSSAGKPVLAPIQGRDLTNAAVVVVRYFGGIKLGVGGLVRAYGGGASAALDEAGARPLTHRECGSLVLDYAALPDAERRLKAEGAEIVRKEFGEKVTLFFEKETL